MAGTKQPGRNSTSAAKAAFKTLPAIRSVKQRLEGDFYRHSNVVVPKISSNQQDTGLLNLDKDIWASFRLLQADDTSASGGPVPCSLLRGTFAVREGPFTLQLEVCTSGAFKQKFSVQPDQRLSVALYIDGIGIATEFWRPVATHVVVFCSHRVMVDKREEGRQLTFAKPQTGNAATDAQTSNGNDSTKGTIELQFRICTQHPLSANPYAASLVLASTAARGQDDKKFFLKQGVAFQSGAVTHAVLPPVNTRLKWLNSFFFVAECRYDLDSYLELRGACSKKAVSQPSHKGGSSQ